MKELQEVASVLRLIFKAAQHSFVVLIYYTWVAVLSRIFLKPEL